MFTYIFIPFMLMWNTYVEQEPILFPTDFVFSFDYSVRLRELALSIQMTGKLNCYSPLRYKALRCFLQDVISKQPIYISNKNLIQYVEKDFKFSKTFWFDIFFDHDNGAHGIRLKDEYWKFVNADIQIKEKVIDLVTSIAYLFKIDNNKINRNLIMKSTSGSSVFTSTEMSTVGTCDTKYNMTVTFNETNDEPSLVFQIIPTFLTQHFSEKKDTHIQVEKYVKVENKEDRKCDHKRLRENFRGTYIKDDFIDNIEKVNSIYKMDIVNGKFNIASVINVRRSPDQLDSGTFVLNQTTLLNLIDIKYSNMICEQPYFDWNYQWIDISI